MKILFCVTSVFHWIFLSGNQWAHGKFNSGVETLMKEIRLSQEDAQSSVKQINHCNTGQCTSQCSLVQLWDVSMVEYFTYPLSQSAYNVWIYYRFYLFVSTYGLSIWRQKQVFRRVQEKDHYQMFTDKLTAWDFLLVLVRKQIFWHLDLQLLTFSMKDNWFVFLETS